MTVETGQAIYSPVKCCRKRDQQPKKGAGCKLIQSRAPNQLWDNCLELEVYIRSNGAYGDVPKMVMSGETYDVSQFFNIEWFEWVLF